MGCLSQEELELEWSQKLPINEGYTFPLYTRYFLDEVKEYLSLSRKRFIFKPNFVEIGPRLNPLSLVMAKEIGAKLRRGFFTDVAYQQLLRLPDFEYPNAKIEVSARGVPKDDGRILDFMGRYPSAFYGNNIVNYIPRDSFLSFLNAADQVIILNNYKAGSELLPEEREEHRPCNLLNDLKLANLNPVLIRADEIRLAGVFERGK